MNRRSVVAEPTAFSPNWLVKTENAQVRALEVVGGAFPLEDALGSLVGLVEAQCQGSLVAAITLVDLPHPHLRACSGPSLPGWFIEAVADMRIAPGMTTWAAAVARGEAVQTPDIAAAESWSGIAHLPLSLGFRAACSTPISGSGGKLLATFDTYFREARCPTRHESGIVAALCRAAAATIERHTAEIERRDADRSRSEFIAVLSHELRGPLAPLTAGIELLSASDGKPAAFDRICAMMERQVNQLVRLAGDLRDVSGMSRGEILCDLAPIALADAIGAAVEQGAAEVHQRGHELVVESVDPCMVRGDLGRLTQVFTNLLINAAKYTPDGGRIRIRSETTADHVRTRVTDTGSGFPPGRTGALFKMFSRLPEHRDRSHDGLGVGLALCARLVELHGGTIEAYSAGSGCGSEFTVSLPRVGTDSRGASFRTNP